MPNSLTASAGHVCTGDHGGYHMPSPHNTICVMLLHCVQYWQCLLVKTKTTHGTGYTYAHKHRMAVSHATAVQQAQHKHTMPRWFCIHVPSARPLVHPKFEKGSTCAAHIPNMHQTYTAHVQDMNCSSHARKASQAMLCHIQGCTDCTCLTDTAADAHGGAQQRHPS